MRQTTVKLLLRAMDLLGRTLVFNRGAPRVGRYLPDRPYGLHRRQRLDIAVPPTEPPYPVLVYFHGGGWMAGDKASYSGLCREFASAGILTFNANYRLTPAHPWPMQVRDAAAATAWAADHAPEFGGRPDGLVLGGDSAGAHLSFWLAAALADPALRERAGLPAAIPADRVRALLLFYGVYDLVPLLGSDHPGVGPLFSALFGADRETQARTAEWASPMRCVPDAMPPAFICCGEPDGLFPQSLELARRLQRRGLPHETLFLDRERHPDAGHAFVSFPRRRSARIARHRAVDFVRAHAGTDLTGEGG